MVLTISQARRLALNSQGLSKENPFGRGLNAVERTVLALRYVQIDTISVVDRAHHHVLKTRVSNYQPQHLDELLSKRKSVFEYWHHAAAYLPMEDYRFYLPLMRGYGASRQINQKVAKQVKRRIEAEGPLMSKDFAAPPGKKTTGWGNWKPAKLALEQLFLSGELMVSSRKGFQKQFDLTERVLPDNVDTSFPDERERAHYYVTRILKAQGIGRAQDIGYMKIVTASFEKFKLLPPIKSLLDEMIETQEIIPIPIGNETYYALKTDIETLPSRLSKSRLYILSPFDNMVINRDKLLKLFGFDYQIECYVPAAKRRYGYFTLPLLLGDQFIGRIDCKAHRDKSTLVIHNIWLEPKTRVSEALIDQFAEALCRYASELDCANIDLLAADDPLLHQKLNQRLTAT
jgi:uncharacterized protein YcaQ